MGWEEIADEVPVERQSYGNFDKLPDGKYVFEVTKAELKKGKYVTYTISLQCVTVEQGKESQHSGSKVYYLERDGEVGDSERKAINGLKADLADIGFAVSGWKASEGKPLAEMLVGTETAMVGLKVNGTVKKNQVKDKTYVNVYLNGRAVDKEGNPIDGVSAKISDEMIADIITDKQNEVPF